jgi:two-component sensor histidine kinase
LTTAKTLAEEDSSDWRLTPQLRAELLDAKSWDEILELYARTSKLMVALLDADGLLVGTCHNQQQIWTLARTAKPDPPGCLFCLETSALCSAVAEATRTHAPTLRRDEAGFAHVALPLMLRDRQMGTLLAGQVFVQYPDTSALARVARLFGLSPQHIWNIARRQVPISEANLAVQGRMLWVMGQAFLQNRYGTILERYWLQKSETLNHELAAVNVTLTQQVAALDQSLMEKETLLLEIHHRVKNNLQVVSSLLSLQMGFQGPSDASSSLQDTYERIHSMSMVHEQIYQSDSLAALDFGEYIEQLAGHLYQSYCLDTSRVHMTVATEPVLLTISQAIPCGLILNELMSNALKHAFHNDREGTLEVILRRGSDHIVELTVADDGVGLPLHFDLQSPKSMGLEVVTLLTSQLEARLDVSRANGTRFVLTFLVTSDSSSVAV